MLPLLPFEGVQGVQEEHSPLVLPFVLRMHADTLMKPNRSSTNYPNLIPGGPGHREGHVQRQVRRVLIAEGLVTTRDMMNAVWMRGEPWTESRWRHMRRAAERFAVREGKRSRPLRWRLKPGFQNKR